MTLARCQEATRSGVKAARRGPPSENLELEELQALQSSRAEACLQGSRLGARFSPCLVLLELINNPHPSQLKEKK